MRSISKFILSRFGSSTWTARSNSAKV
jgi:hypothetical protein